MTHHRFRPAVLLLGATLVIGAGLAAGCSARSALAPDALAYGRPDPDPAVYSFADTATFTIETAMGSMQVVTAHAGIAELDFHRWAGDSRVFIRFPELRASFHNPAQGSRTVDESAIGGAFSVRVDHEGLVAVTDTPPLSEVLRDIVGPESLVRPLFVHLPARPVEAGAQWVDTVRTVEEGGGTRSEAWSVITSVLDSDTVVAGRRLTRIRTRAVSNVVVRGTSGGVEVEERLSGTTRGLVLWDPVDRLLVERVETGELSGTLEMPDTGAGSMPMTARVTRVVTLRE